MDTKLLWVKSLILLLLCWFSVSVAAQTPVAGFTADKVTGCAPLTVNFTNTTAGASAAAVYKWEFGNSRSAATRDAGTIFTEEREYEVRLTVTDGAATSVKTMKITVKAKPVVNFTYSPSKACAPLSVSFNGTAGVSDGATVVQYLWDFGDGATDKGTNAAPAHTYTRQQMVSVSLTVTDSYGCSATENKPDIIDVGQPVKALFTPDKSMVCSTGDKITFTNNSTGPGTLTYLWAFGDGGTSAEASPSYTYSGSGSYKPKLTVTSSEGCSSTYELGTGISVGTVKADFTVPPLVCTGSNTTFTSTTVPVPDYTGWSFNDGVASGNVRKFAAAGEYELTMTAYYSGCNVQVKKKIQVIAAPALNGIVVESNGACGAPATVTFRDTTKAALTWQWAIDKNNVSDKRDVTHSFTVNGSHFVALTITDATGCSSLLETTYYLEKPVVNIYYTYSSSPNGLSGCEGLVAEFNTIVSQKLSAYQWDLGDGGTSTDAKPGHTFNKAGVYNVALNYTTESGCKGTAYLYNVAIYPNPDIDFTVKEANPICGNNIVHFDGTAKNSATVWFWYYEGDYKRPATGSGQGAWQYSREGVYTVILVAANGTCRDTAVKSALLTVKPPFVYMDKPQNFCEGDRKRITIRDTSRQVTQWHWDFGDGATMDYTDKLPSVSHTYPKTGIYKVVMTGYNGTCSVKDSDVVYVFDKQYPKLTIGSAVACSSDSLHVEVAYNEANPSGGDFDGDFKIRWETSRGVTPSNPILLQSPYFYWTQTYKGTLQWLPPGTDSIRAITLSEGFGCRDTTDFVKVHIKGPVADFTTPSNSVCYNTPNVFVDKTASKDGVPLVSWEWNFGDTTPVQKVYETKTIEHIYENPWRHMVVMKVTDQEGCYGLDSMLVNTTGPKADFIWQPDQVKPDTWVYFTNKSNTYGGSVSYTWIFSNSNSTSGLANPNQHYDQPGVDTVTLIASNPFSSCVDTVIKLIYIKNIQAEFTSSVSYVNGNSCPPALVSFTNTSQNYTRVSWDFGDGSTSGNSNAPTHIYNKPGTYIAKVYAYDDTDEVDSASHEVVIKGPVGYFTADKPFLCGVPAKVTYTAITNGVTDITWDLADGPLIHTKETTITHEYKAPGGYKPAIILKDDKGCEATFEMAVPLVIDTLKALVGKNSSIVCDSGSVQFSSKAVNIGADQFQLPVHWHWDFGTGNAADTSNSASPAFFYNTIGKHIVNVTVVSTAGCAAVLTDSVIVKPKTRGNISGPSDICVMNSATFAGTVSGDIENRAWYSGDGTVISDSISITRAYTKAGEYKVLFLVTNAGCTDTASHTLTVHALPDIQLQPGKKAFLCQGDTLELTAHNGIAYSWLPAVAITNTAVASPGVYPPADTTYTVQVTDVYGCVNKDSVRVTVVYPFTVLLNDADVCRGETITLNASGSDMYKWISGSGLSNQNIANPTVIPSVTGSYTVVGYDAAGCFTDTATAKVIVRDVPVVSTIADTILQAGNSLQLPVTASSNVVKYEWSPASYLDCAGCQSPVSTPRSSVTYVITARTAFGCKASDTVRVGLRCEEGSVFIPNSFTPNKDSRNDVFYPRGKGIRLIKYFRIYNRLGELVFERRNFQINDASQGWDGTYNGNAISNSVFNYVAEMICDGGDSFMYRGTVLLLH